MLDFFTDPSFMPHGFCLRWQTGLLWLHVVSDAFIALAYFSIPATMIYYLKKRTAITAIPGIYLAVGAMFACFIVFCGITHVLGMITIWKPWYAIEGAGKFATALVSVVTAIALIPIIPKALTLRTAEELEHINAALRQEVDNRKMREQELARINDELRAQIEARETAEENEHRATEERRKAEKALQDLRAAQARIIESEKLASLGKSMAGIAHEVNTPVGIAITATTSLAEETEWVTQAVADRTLSERQLNSFLDTAREATNLSTESLKRAATLLQSVKQVAADQSNRIKRSFDLRDYLQIVLQSIKPKFFASRREVHLQCPENLRVTCPPGAISQISTNLVLNALIHAYGEADSGDVYLSVEEDGGQITLICEDHGKGIPDDLQSRIFEPFFTTKAESGGSGIGLDLVSSLVREELHGTVELQSEVNQGSRFIIRFPADAPASESDTDQAED